MNPKKKDVDYGALQSAWTRIPRIDTATARDLLDLGFEHPDQIIGRAPEVLFEQVLEKKPNTPRARLHLFRLAVYYAETPEPDPAKLHPSAWAD